MTCVVGIEHNGRVYLGGDRYVGDENNSFLADHPKVWVVGEGVVMGAFGSLIGLQLLKYKLKLPKFSANKHDPVEWLITQARGPMSDCLEGLAKKSRADMLVGVGGKLYAVDGATFDCVHVGPEFASGTGGDFARGALCEARAKTPSGRIMAALNASVRCCPQVAPPFDLVDA